MRRRGPAKAHGPPTRTTSRGSISSVSSRESEESQGLLAAHNSFETDGRGGSRPGAGGNTSGAYAPRRSVGHGSLTDTSIARAAKVEKKNRTEAALQVAEHVRDWLDTKSLADLQHSLDDLLLGLQIEPDDDEAQVVEEEEREEENNPLLAQGSGDSSLGR